jgi:hypothetical protein
MTIFEADRERIASLSDQNAFFILGLLDCGLPHKKAPPRLRATLEAARRIPDVSRYFLVNKAQKYVDDQCRRGKGIE